MRSLYEQMLENFQHANTHGRLGRIFLHTKDKLGLTPAFNLFGDNGNGRKKVRNLIGA